ncbi:PA domain protein [Dictyocaulus viviparus]|uniref:PA domain protein n=1 Tax=Dictyocaulus viviparus TaxID=29172 RepID=A0A0D8XA59_DICVI|nr:PA domain protein [Dictyocaulus viviparus]
MPSTSSHHSNDDFFVTEQLLSNYSPLNFQDSFRISHRSIIKSTKAYSNRRRLFPVALIGTLLGAFAIVGALIIIAGLVIKQKSCELPQKSAFILLREDQNELDRISKELASRFDPVRLKENVRWMAETSHIAGTIENSILIRRLADEYIKLGFKVNTYNYNVLLNYPDFDNANTVMVKEDDSSWKRLSRGRGQPKGPQQAVNEQMDGQSEVWWNAYSANGSVEGRIVYCNFGTSLDFQVLQEKGVTVNGSIVLMRYGIIVRSEKVAEAEKRGAIGVILFSDPAHHISVNNNMSFLNSTSLPGTAAQRGTVGRVPGDPLTPFLPSLPYVTRTETIESLRQKKLLPSIPVTPIGYIDAQRIMDHMDGPLVTRVDWIGGLTSYRLSSTREFQLSVRSRFVKKTITNIVATLNGIEEPDRWIMLGNHVDAWGKGAIDPISGTAVQLEVANVVSKVNIFTIHNFFVNFTSSQNKRQVFGSSPPRRSVVFCHWDAEEFGLIGSSEWIEQRLAIIQRRAVAYINVDHIAGGKSLDIKAVPLLYQTIWEALKRLPYSNALTTNSILDIWKNSHRDGLTANDHKTFDIGLPGGGSDYQRFITFAGIPVADLKMEQAPGQSYALYHTMYETPWTVENLIDPHFSAFTSIGRLWIEIVHRLASSLVIPFGVLDYAQSLTSLFQKAELSISRMNLTKAVSWLPHKLNSLKVSLERLQKTSPETTNRSSDAFNSLTNNYFIISKTSECTKIIANGQRDVSVQRLESINMRLQYVERSFLDMTDVHNPYHRHLVFSPSMSFPRFTSFSSILDPAMNYQRTNDEKYLLSLDMAITKVQYAVESAIDTLH